MSLNKAPNNHVFYRNQNWIYPKIVAGRGIYLYDDSGKEYIDGCSGSAVANIGHGNKDIALYAKEQIEKIAFTHLSRWTMDPIEECAAAVARWCPGDLNHVYFVSGGSEATETALKMARQYFVERDGTRSSKWKVISKWNSFHGNTLGSLSMTGIKGRRRIYDPLLIDFPKIPQFYHYRNPWGCQDPEETSVKAALALEEEIQHWGAENIAAFISEPVVGSAAPGVHPAPGYFKMVREICSRYDILLILDEVMTGFGRTGRRFGIDHFGIVPDIMTTGKGMSAGFTPLGAAVAGERVFNTIMVEGSGHFIHGHTYAGNPLSCGIARRVIRCLEEQQSVDNVKVQGDYLLSRLRELEALPIVGEVRGKGLLLGMEFVQDKAGKEPFPRSAEIGYKVMVNALQQGLVVYPGSGCADGILGDHILLAPPLTITRDQVDLLVQRLAQALAETCAELNIS